MSRLRDRLYKGGKGLFEKHVKPFDEADVWGLNDPHLKDFPKEGLGKRALFCRRYDHCLYKAAVKDWDTFHCEGCHYEKAGDVNFIPSEFAPFDDEFNEAVGTDDDFFQVPDMDYYSGIAWFEEEIKPNAAWS